MSLRTSRGELGPSVFDRTSGLGISDMAGLLPCWWNDEAAPSMWSRYPANWDAWNGKDPPPRGQGPPDRPTADSRNPPDSRSRTPGEPEPHLPPMISHVYGNDILDAPTDK